MGTYLKPIAIIILNNKTLIYEDISMTLSRNRNKSVPSIRLFKNDKINILTFCSSKHKKYKTKTKQNKKTVIKSEKIKIFYRLILKREKEKES